MIRLPGRLNVDVRMSDDRRITRCGVFVRSVQRRNDDVIRKFDFGERKKEDTQTACIYFWKKKTKKRRRELTLNK